MSTKIRSLPSQVILGIGLSVSASATAQVDVAPPRPNVLLAVDTSGSMGYKANVATIQNTVCNVSGASDKSRWIGLVESLTGTITNYHCQDVNRSAASFLTEFTFGGAEPPDYLYPLAWQRPVSGTCTPYPDKVNNVVAFKDVNTGLACGTPFTQSSDGLIDAFSGQLRFGLVTFDTLPSAALTAAGTYSYMYPRTGPSTGKPVSCTTAEQDYEVGIRNAAAPPWEGGMVAFGPPDSSLDDVETVADAIQARLLSLRPFGATPIDAMLDDIRDYYWNDPNPDDTGRVAPKNDPYSLDGCRENYVILLTDGEPNMNLRTACQGANATCTGPDTANPCCPYEKAETIAAALAAGGTGKFPVKTFVVGYALSTVSVSGVPTAVDCSTLAEDPNHYCATAPANSGLAVCCTLQKIAVAGETEGAFFANNVTELRTALSEIFTRIAGTTMSRTLPVLASASSSSSEAAAFRFFTSFHPRSQGTGLPDGVIERQRYVCANDVDDADICEEPSEEGANEAVACRINENKGDDFVANINDVGSTNRKFYSVLPAASGTARYASASIRPSMASPGDGFGAYSGTLVTGSKTSFTGTLSPYPEALAPMPRADRCTGLTATQCVTQTLNWVIGNDATATYTRCRTPGTDCGLVSDIYHSTPVLVNRPTEDIRDQTYQAFANTWATRPMVLYAATNDGLLHAFKVASNNPLVDTSATSKVEAKTMNELWSFIPPAVLPRLADQYPSIRLPLLDGSPVARDVPAITRTDGSIRFERATGDFTASRVTWRTVLVQGYGKGPSDDPTGYYAIDITDPVNGPRFLWQLSTDLAGNALFGTRSGTPTITTLYFDPEDGSRTREIAVALLPGGDGPTSANPDPAVTCTRSSTSPSGVDTDFPIRTAVPCYTDAGLVNRAASRRARSLTVVRLDTGEVIRTFRKATADAPATLSTRVIVSPLDSPITGQATAYPGWVGSTAERAYVGDRDGTLWRVDLSSTDPDSWTMSMVLDAYANVGSDPNPSTPRAHDGFPIMTAPVVSTDELGRIVVAFATGDPDNFVGTSSIENYVYSVTDTIGFGTSAVSVSSNVNWYYRFLGGRRVVGPMTLLSSNLYFSTYTPASTGSNVCGRGTSEVAGMHYNLIETGTSPTQSDPTATSKSFSVGGRAALPTNLSPTATTRVQFVNGSLLTSDVTDNPLVFGVAIAQKPSCVTEETITDGVFGGNHVKLQNDSAAEYELVVQVGSASGLATTGGNTNVTALPIPSPDNSPLVNSWASVTD